MADEFDQFEPGERTIDQTAEGAASLVDTLGQNYDKLASAEDSPNADKGDAGGPDDGEGKAGAGQQGGDGAGPKDAAGSDADGGASAPADGDGVSKPGGEAALEAPVHWSLNDREMFAKQTPEAQKWLLDRSNAMEAAHTKRSQELADERNGMAPLNGVVTKWGGYLGQMGATPDQAFDSLMQVEYTLRTGTPAQKVAALRKIVTDYGITAPKEGEDLTPAADPRVDALQHQIQQMTAGQQQQQRAAQQAQVAQAAREVETFRNEMTEAGKPAHPYFGEVEAEMTKWAQADLAAGVQPEIKSLYERACWSSPAVREKLIAEQTAVAQAKQAEDVKKKRAAGATISGAGSAPAEKPKDLRQSLADRWDAMVAA